MSHARPRRLGWGWLLSLIWSTALGVLIFTSATLLSGGGEPTPVPSPGLPANWAADFPARIDHEVRLMAAVERAPDGRQPIEP